MSNFKILAPLRPHDHVHIVLALRLPGATNGSSKG